MKFLAFISFLCLAAAAVYDIPVRNAAGDVVPSDKQPRVLNAPRQKIQNRRIRETSPNLCGAMQISKTSDTFQKVIGSWTIPPVLPVTTPNYTFYQWVGIGQQLLGAPCAMIRAGTALETNGVLLSSIYAWYQYYPMPIQIVKEMKLNDGDRMTVEIDLMSDTTGVIYFDDDTTGQSFGVSFDGTGHGQICGQTAEWMGENPNGWAAAPGPPYASAEFPTCLASTAAGDYNLDGAIFFDGGSPDDIRCKAIQQSSLAMELNFI